MVLVTRSVMWLLLRLGTLRLVSGTWMLPRFVLVVGRGLSRASTTTAVSLDQLLAEAVGVLCGKPKASDVIDASVVLAARREGASIVASDIDLRHLDKAVVLHRI
jgi:hypothetical protein